MARPKTPKTTQPNTNYGSDSKFSSLNLTSNDKESFDTWLVEKAPSLEDGLAIVLDESYRVSLKFDYNNNAHQCSITQQDNKHKNSGIILVSRAGSAEEAFFICLYKIYVLCPDDALPTQDEQNNWG